MADPEPSSFPVVTTMSCVFMASPGNVLQVTLRGHFMDTSKRRVLLLCTLPLLGEGLEKILSKLGDVELIGPWVLDAQALARLPERMPDVVLIAEEEKKSGKVISITTQILERYPDLPVVQIGLARNSVRLFTSRTLPARSADLIEIIRSLPVQHT